MDSEPSLRLFVERLAEFYGPAPAPHPTDPLELVLWENVAYLADDTRRGLAFEQLRATVGTRPEQLLSATRAELTSVTDHGAMGQKFATKLREVGETALAEFDGDLAPVLESPVASAKRALRRFPGIGEPGAEKILLYTRSHPFLAPDSNGLRVMVRLGICPQRKSYSSTYAGAREVAQDQLGSDYDLLLSARHYLRRHGKETCRRRDPACEACVLRVDCPFPSAGLGVV